MTVTLTYGPNTAEIRAFLVALSSLSDDARAEAAARFDVLVTARPFSAADSAVGDLIERSGRADARDALAGPLLQLARRTISKSTDLPQPDDALDGLEPFAEPALAALLALLTRDLLPAQHFTALYAAFDGLIPLAAASLNNE